MDQGKIPAFNSSSASCSFVGDPPSERPFGEGRRNRVLRVDIEQRGNSRHGCARDRRPADAERIVWPRPVLDTLALHGDRNFEPPAESLEHSHHQWRKPRAMSEVVEGQARRCLVGDAEARRREMRERELQARVHLIQVPKKFGKGLAHRTQQIAAAAIGGVLRPVDAEFLEDRCCGRAGHEELRRWPHISR